MVRENDLVNVQTQLSDGRLLRWAHTSPRAVTGDVYTVVIYADAR
jgi:hypothetical protein